MDLHPQGKFQATPLYLTKVKPFTHVMMAGVTKFVTPIPKDVTPFMNGFFALKFEVAILRSRDFITLGLVQIMLCHFEEIAIF